MKTITLLSKFRVTSANQLKLHLQQTLLASTQTSFFEICTNGLLPFIFLFFCFQDLFSKFSNLLFVLVPGGWPWEHLLFSFDLDKTSKSNGENNHKWSALSALKFDKKGIISFRKKIKYEPGSWNFFNFIISLWNVKQMFWDNNFVPLAHHSCYTF